jgi:hypothetical protein
MADDADTDTDTDADADADTDALLVQYYSYVCYGTITSIHILIRVAMNKYYYWYYYCYWW